MSKNNCDVLLDDFEDTFDSLEKVFVDSNSGEKFVKNIFGLGGSLTKLALTSTVCAVKTVQTVKEEIVNTIEEELLDEDKKEQQKAFDEKLDKLSKKYK